LSLNIKTDDDIAAAEALYPDVMTESCCPYDDDFMMSKADFRNAFLKGIAYARAESDKRITELEERGDYDTIKLRLMKAKERIAKLEAALQRIVDYRGGMKIESMKYMAKKGLTE
jgi:hypothetical protein